jgi:uncharacterized protein
LSQNVYFVSMKHGNLVWFEIPVADLDRAAAFYAAVLGCKIEKFSPMGQEYGLLRKEDAGIGGVLIPKAGFTPCAGPVLFFFVNVLSDAIENAERHGGKVITPKTLLRQTGAGGQRTIGQNLIDNKVGYFCQLLDSEGNAIALYSNF